MTLCELLNPKTVTRGEGSNLCQNSDVTYGWPPYLTSAFEQQTTGTNGGYDTVLNQPQVPLSSTRSCDCSFPVTAPTAWNRLPGHEEFIVSGDIYITAHDLSFPLTQLSLISLNVCRASFSLALTELRHIINCIIDITIIIIIFYLRQPTCKSS